MKKIIHVNQFHIKHNKKNPKDPKPVITIKTYKENIYSDEVQILGPSKLVYSPEKPLNCGARVWISTEADVLLSDGRVI